MNCVNCGAPLPPKTTRCPFCQSLNDVDLRGQIAVRRRATSRDCPRCRDALDAVDVRLGPNAVEIDRCATCFGLFFDPEELDAVLDGIEAARSGAAGSVHAIDHRQLLTLVEQETPTEDFKEVAYVPCPDCGQLMHRRQFGQKSGVIVDTCRDHGLWLDGGELRRLIRWTQAGGRRHAAASEAEKKRLDRELQKTPYTVPGPPPTASRGGRLEPIFGGPGGIFDAFDILSVLGSLLRGLR